MGEKESSTNFGRAVIDSHVIGVGKYEIRIDAYQDGAVKIDPYFKDLPFGAMLSKQVTTKDNPGWKKQVEEVITEMKRELGLMDRVQANKDLSLDFLRNKAPRGEIL